MVIHLADGTRRQFRTLLRKPKRGNWEGFIKAQLAFVMRGRLF
jgi:hypothetical protein